jgi:hypothetical protein
VSPGRKSKTAMDLNIDTLMGLRYQIIVSIASSHKKNSGENN